MSATLHQRPPRSARRASVYLAVLSVALVVTVIGMSALTALRNEQAALRLSENAAQADLYAQSAVDLALRTIVNNASWRTAYANNTWYALATLGDAALAFKLIDETDSVLSDDPNDPVRIYGRCALAGAVRIYSARVARSGRVNVVTNGDFESGTAGWTGDDCSIQVSPSNPHGGNQCLRVYNRTYSYSDTYQDLTSELRNGATYNIDVWIRMESSGTNVQIWLGVDGSGSDWTWFGGATTWVGTSWTQVSTTITPTWTGSLSDAIIGFDTYSSGSTNSFRLDDMMMKDTNAERLLAFVPGTWRREVRTGTAEAGVAIPTAAAEAK